MNYYQTNTNLGAASIIAGLGAYSFFATAISILMIVCLWITFKKAGKEGWKSIIPIYNIIVLLEIVELPIWYIILLIIPLANIYATIKIYIELAHKFGKSTGFGIGLLFLGIVFLPILAFDKKVVYKENNINSDGINQFINTQPEPVIQQPEPVIQQPEPIVQQPEPIVQQPEPIVQQPEPIVQQPEPVIQQPEPIVQQPEPIVQQPEPIVQQPEPIVQQPEPIVDQYDQLTEETPANTKICPVCGNTIGAELTTCVMCGSKLD